MKVLCVNVVNPTKTVETQYSSLGLAYIASYVKKYLSNDIKFVLVDTDNIDEILPVEKPDLVAISSVTPNFSKAERIAKSAKAWADIPVVVGGPHITLLPHTLKDCFDIAVLREGEDTMLHILRLFLAGDLKPDTLSQVKGIASHRNGSVVITEPRPMITPLDKIPFPDRTLRPVKYLGYMLTSRGCPYRCVFCSSSCHWGGIRYFSPEYVVAEMRELCQHREVEEINLEDDLFAMNKKRLRRIADLVVKEKLHRKVTFACAGRANVFDEDTAILLSKMCVRQIYFGFESGTDRVLGYLKPKVTVAQNQAAIDLCRKHGIKVTGAFIIGSPDETLEEIQATLEFIRKNSLQVGINILTPLPGTHLWEYAKGKGLVFDEMDWNIFEWESMTNPNRIIVSEKVDRMDLKHLLEEIIEESKGNYWDDFIRTVKYNWLFSVPRWRRTIRQPKKLLITVCKLLQNKK